MIASAILNEDPTLTQPKNGSLSVLKEQYKPKNTIDYGMIS
jgi:hypothetical protein